MEHVYVYLRLLYVEYFYFYYNMNLQEINITNNETIILISDCHCKLENLQKVKSLYPHYKIISLGDNCDLYARNSNSNQLIIQFYL